MTKLTRRQFLSHTGFTILGAGIGAGAVMGTDTFMTSHKRSTHSTDKNGMEIAEFDLSVRQMEKRYMPKGRTNVMAYNDGVPILRVKQGQTIRVHVKNDLPEQQTTIHWHGVRLPNEMDGVPILTQDPIEPGDSFVYEFECVDAGSFWFHTHINSKVQMRSGMVGLLIIEDETTDLYDNDIAWGYQDLALLDDGNHYGNEMKSSMLMHAAAMGGILGNFPRVNGNPIVKNTEKVKAGSVVRLRFLNVDNTRIMKLSLYKGEEIYKDAQIVALDGNALNRPIPLNRYRMGPAMRVDIAIKIPTTVGEELTLKNVFAETPYAVGSLKVIYGDSTKKAFPPLPKLNPIPKPDLKNAITLDFEFSNMAISPAKHGADEPMTFWGINKRAWGSEDVTAENYPEPLARLEYGKTYIFRLKNITKFSHPIHMHGHTWWVVSASKKKSLIDYHTDTVLIRPREEIEVAFVADNLGGWMYHCHIVDHMMTGMMGYITVK